MKTLFSLIIIAMSVITISYGQANTTLSNLVSPTSINQSLLPNNNNGRDLGSASKSWRTLYIDSSIYLKNVLFIQNKGVQNVFVGEGAGTAITTGLNNAVLGFHAMYSNKINSANTAFGNFALFKNRANNNTAVGFQAMYSNTTATLNTAIGYQALYSNTTGSPNTAVGWGALYSNTTGIENTAVGQGALYSNTIAYDNTALGRGALFSNTEGRDNTSAGFKALFYNTTGTFNTANGSEALEFNVTGTHNTALGTQALNLNLGSTNTALGAFSLNANTTADNNTATGYGSLIFNTTGGFNVANGSEALFQNETGSFNVANGFEALYFTTTGSFNTSVGENANADLSEGSYNTIIGAKAHISGNNSVVLGYNSYTNGSNVALLGNTTTAFCGGYVNWTNYASDKRLKTQVKENVKGLDFINRLRPVTYHLDIESIYKIQGISRYGMQENKMTDATKESIDKNIKDKEAVLMSGFIAQEVEQAAKESGYDFDGVKKPQNDKDNYGLSYATFVVPLVKAVQELSKMNDAKDSLLTLQQKINIDLQQQINDLKTMIVSSQSMGNNQSAIISVASLSQNIPNPFTHTTSIAYSIPNKFSSAKIIITDKSGNTLKAINISNNKGNVSVDASALVAGAYQYSLLVDGKLIDTKQMILSK